LVTVNVVSPRDASSSVMRSAAAVTTHLVTILVAPLLAGEQGRPGGCVAGAQQKRR
jgi:hypothetical protein